MLFEDLRCIAWGPKEMWVLLMCKQCGTGTWLESSRTELWVCNGFALLAQGVSSSGGGC